VPDECRNLEGIGFGVKIKFNSPTPPWTRGKSKVEILLDEKQVRKKKGNKEKFRLLSYCFSLIANGKGKFWGTVKF